MQASNFAHVIFQNVAKSYIPHAPLECHYILTTCIKPHHKDWVGIFKVGWSTARDYYTFLWSQVPENYAEGTSVNRMVAFQGYYLPNDDGEFYQFCYVTHKGEIRGASTPFQFRAPSPTDDLLTMEDDANLDMLVVTTKTSLLEKKIEMLLKEKEELINVKSDLEQQTTQLCGCLEKREKEIIQEKEVCEQIKKEYKDLLQSSESMEMQKEDIEKKYEEAVAKIIQLEKDIVLANQNAIGRETELDSIKHKLRKLTAEKEQLELHLKNEKDEKELYKIHAKNMEIENTKLVKENHSVKNLDASKECMLTHYKEEMGRLQQCLSEKDKLQKELLLNSSNMEDVAILKEHLRRAEEQLQASEQKVALMAKELGDVSNARDKAMGDLHNARIEIDVLKTKLADTETKYQLDIQFLKAAVSKNEKQSTVDNTTVEQELHKEVEDLKLRLHMVAEHYKEKYKECQKLQKQVVRLSEQLEEKKNETASKKQNDDGTNTELPPGTAEDLFQNTPSASPALFYHSFEVLGQTQMSKMNNEIADKTEMTKKCKPILAEECERSQTFAEELAQVQQKWNEHLQINNDLTQDVAEEVHYKVLLSKKEEEVKELKANLADLVEVKEILEEINRELSKEVNTKGGGPVHEHEGSNTQNSQSLGAQKVLQYPNPYSSETLLVPMKQPGLQFGNPYAEPRRDGEDGALYPDEIRRVPLGISAWGLDSNVVCSQPSRNFSRPDGLEDPDDLINDEDVNVSPVDVSDPQSFLLQERGSHFCFQSSFDIHKKCPLCDLVFPPNYDQSKFEEHVESHWKVCPMCNEQFAPDCDQQIFEKHVLMHFPENIQSFD